MKLFNVILPVLALNLVSYSNIISVSSKTKIETAPVAIEMPATFTVTIRPVIEKTKPEILKKIVLMRIDGKIEDLAPKAQKLYQLGMKKEVLGAIICINSGGGSAGAAELVQKAIDFVKTKNKPVFIFVEDVAASGAYMIACAGSKIYAGDFSEVGSIGVVFRGEHPKEARKLINSLVVGKYKRYTYTPEGELTEESKQAVIDMLKKIYLKFRTDVAARRNISLEKIDSWEADTFSGSEALERGLIDVVGSLDQAIFDLKKLVTKSASNQDQDQLLVLVDEDDKELLKI